MRDLRKYAHQTNTRLALGALILLFGVGGGLIYIFYGARAMLLGLICLLLGLAPIFLIWLALYILEWVTKKADQT